MKLFETISINPKTTLALMSIKCVTLRVREYADMISINNQQRDLEIHIDSHIFNEDHYR
jgi:hypothetical protein